MEGTYVRYGIAFVLVGAALVATLYLYPLILISPFFFVAVILSTWQGGAGPGLVSVVLAAASIDYFFLEPLYQLGFGIKQLLNVIGFVVTAGLVSSLVAKRRRAEASLSHSYETLEATVQERTAHLRRVSEQLRAEIAERERTQAALGDTQAALARMARVTTMGELAATIAHEVNQPLAAIAANGNACLRWLGGNVPDLGEARAAAQRIVRDAHRAGEVVGRIRSLVSGTPPQRVPVHLNDLVRDVMPLVLGEVRRGGATLRLELGDDLPSVCGDGIQLQQVVLNLVMNGLEAMRDLPGERRLVMRTAALEGGTVLSLEDTGIGIAPQEVGQVFDAFHSTKPDGMGMGLSVCRTIVEAHGGRIWFTANEGPGVTFHVLLPRAGATS